MKFTAVNTKTGEVLYSGGAHNPELLAEPGISIILSTPESIKLNYWSFEESVWRTKPARPAPYFVFDYESEQWVDPRTPETEWPLIRAERNQLLQASDWTQLPDVPLATKEAWATYRQALRDITLQPDPFNIVWPAVPG